nr:MAG TPA: hypothetical protein [Caudoviricetes sp.]
MSEFTLVELIGNEDVEARSYKVFNFVAVHLCWR